MNELLNQHCFALLDDSRSSVPASRLYTDLVEQIHCHGAPDLKEFFERIEQAGRDGLHVVGLFDYELGADLIGLSTREKQHGGAQALVFRRCERLDARQVSDWLDAQVGQDAVAGLAHIQADVSQAEFEAALGRIHRYIEAGDTYQVNYTFRFTFETYGEPCRLYQRLRQRQPVAFGTLIALPDGGCVVSLSPELFVRHERGRLTAQPMKGTLSASGDPVIDQERAIALSQDEKNRAENLMIVDLLRNDLGRVAQSGSVAVPALFEVRAYGSVLQMTSTVTAEVRSDLDLCQVFGALFPCGSITGAPKRRTMEIIDEVERSPRGLYTGAIGWFDAPEQGRALGDFCLSVPIRTLQLGPASSMGVRKGRMGVGAGIVYDSVPADEFAECLLKARFLTGLLPEFSLFETLCMKADGRIPLLERHMTRIRSSADELGFTFDEAHVRAVLHSLADAEPVATERRVRIELKPDGQLDCRSVALTPVNQPVDVLIAATTIQSTLFSTRHKTTRRAHYDAAVKAAEAVGAFDQLFFNDNDELVEGARTNVLLMLDGQWWTPPISAGALPGVMRAELLADPAWNCRERRLTRQDVRDAERIVVCNALRGPLEARLRHHWE